MMDDDDPFDIDSYLVPTAIVMGIIFLACCGFVILYYIEKIR